MDGNVPVAQVFDSGAVPARRLTSLWLDSGILSRKDGLPGGLTSNQLENERLKIHGSRASRRLDLPPSHFAALANA